MGTRGNSHHAYLFHRVAEFPCHRTHVNLTEPSYLYHTDEPNARNPSHPRSKVSLNTPESKTKQHTHTETDTVTHAETHTYINTHTHTLLGVPPDPVNPPPL